MKLRYLKFNIITYKGINDSLKVDIKHKLEGERSILGWFQSISAG